MNFLRTLDLYKAIVLLSLLALPAGGWYVLSLDESIAACKKTLQDAKRPGGLIEQIGSLQRKVEVVVQNRSSMGTAIKEPRTYFEAQILAAGAGLRTSDFSPLPPKEDPSTIGKQRISDFVVDIDWRKDLTGKMDFVFAVLFNCESGATANSSQLQQSVWKLRELTLVNATDESKTSRYDTPPPELEDKWKIAKMSFARREPKKAN
jgi:hypothetical protein